MDQFANFAISKARFTWLTIIIFCLAGYGVFQTQPRQEDPEIQLRSAQIVAQLPGLSPERIEQLITRPIEDIVKTIPEIKEINSLSTTGMAIVTPEIDSQYSDLRPIWEKLRNKMRDLEASLPSGTKGPNVNDDFGQVAVITLALTGEEYSMAEKYSAARDIRDRLSALPLVAKVDLYGVQSECIWLEFDPTYFAQFGLTPQKIVGAIQAQNVVLPGGTVEADGQYVVIEPSGDFQSLEDIKNVAVLSEDGQAIYLRDLATVRRGLVDPPQSPAFFNGQPAIVFGVSMVANSNVVELGSQVRAELGTVNQTLPLGMNLDIAIFQPDLVEASVSAAVTNLLQTVAVVLLVVMLALGLTTGLIVGAMVPLTMLVTLVGMMIMGIPLHRVSIAAVIVALGLLVDNGVVVAEDIKRRLDLGIERRKAVLDTSRSLALPLLTSSLTTVAAFVPLMLISGGSGEFLKSLGQVLAIALLSSWFIAISVIPAFCFWYMPAAKPSSGTKVKEKDPYGGKGYRLYRKFLDSILRIRFVFVAILIALLFSSTLIFGFIKQRSLGPSERNQFTVYIDLPSQASVQETIGVTQRVSDYLKAKSDNPEVNDVLAYVGNGGPRFFLSLSPNDPQPNKAFLVVSTFEPKQIHPVMARIERFLIEHVPEANGRADILFLGTAALGTVEIQIQGTEIRGLRTLSAQVEDVFHGVEGTTGIRNNWENAVLKIRTEIDQDQARRAGLSSEQIAQSLASYYDGATVTQFRDGELTLPVKFRAPKEERGNLDRMRTVDILSSTTGSPVPLMQVANFSGIVEPSRIRRFNQERTLSVYGRHTELTSLELYEKMKAGLDAIEVPLGYDLAIEGEIKDSQESNGDLFEFAPHALFGILLLLVLQFNSFRRPAIILMTIPLVLIGANYGLFAFGAFFDFTAMLGLFSLAGIIINNGIVLIDKIDEGRDEGLGVHESILAASLARVRPIIMTTITTIVGLVPLALFGGEFWYGMAIVIMCGIGVGSVLTLGFVPVLYSLLFDFRGRTKPKSS